MCRSEEGESYGSSFPRSRPIYIPPQLRKKQQKQQPRFHDAFTGGFSAGFFNTVDTKEGWKPKNNITSRLQTLEDFMDNQDHQEWGGPTEVRQEYANTEDTTTTTITKPTKSSSSPLESLLKVTVSHQTMMGPRLLRWLGWRDGTGTAFVPSNGSGASASAAAIPIGGGGEDHHLEEETRVLLQKKLRKIQLLQKMVKIPPPKLDPCGLGFEPHKDAPEFRQHKERRQQLARDLASRGGCDDNVYRASHLTLTTTKSNGNHRNDDPAIPSKNSIRMTTTPSNNNNEILLGGYLVFVRSKTLKI